MNQGQDLVIETLFFGSEHGHEGFLCKYCFIFPGAIKNSHGAASDECARVVCGTSKLSEALQIAHGTHAPIFSAADLQHGD